jgi:hypothetical protein
MVVNTLRKSTQKVLLQYGGVSILRGIKLCEQQYLLPVQLDNLDLKIC